jgi:uncharacterized phage infection (PIP) family protein YhgE
VPIGTRHATTQEKEAPMSTRTAYIEKIKLQLDELNASLAQLEAKATEARADMHATYHAELDKLRHQSTLALAKLEEIKTSTEDGWAKASTEMEKVRDAFVHAFRYFKSQI